MTDAERGRPAAPRLIDRLRAPCAYDHPVGRVELVETHISWVLLAGDYAYKIKKPVALGFLDFSTLEKRRFYCAEELRLNRRLAPDYYLDVVRVTGDETEPRFGGDGPAREFAVKMRRFPQHALLTRRDLDAAVIDAVVERVAAFHASQPPAPPESPYGAPDAVLAAMLDNCAAIRASLGAGAARSTELRTRIDRLDRWTRERFEQLRGRLQRRRTDGFIRECHGDLHRGNIALINAEPVIFDCIEFNAGLRWIDTFSELAFLVMDLTEAGEKGLARRAVNRYSELTGDYRGPGLLRFYTVYRSLVRAKVMAIRLRQHDLQAEQRSAALSELRKYIRLAGASARAPKPRLLITCGLSGSGKTSFGARLREHMELIHVRSDIERKRLFGLPADARTDSAAGDGIYAPEASQRTYARLLELAEEILHAGYSVLVDATFLKYAQRAMFGQLAARLGCPFRILVLDAPTPVLRRRVATRLASGQDASEAPPAILEQQIAARERLRDAERQRACFLDSTKPIALGDVLRCVAGK
ncbi:MAG: AAA family ATPase [Thiohalocapsa sp.]|nr:AAA family ATPase [Thiohalocapsa sp.]